MSTAATDATPASQATQLTSGPWREILLLLCILAVAAGLRNYRISSESLWHDEVTTVQCFDAPTFTQFMQEVRSLDPAAVPVYFWMAYQWWHLVSGSEPGLRALSVLFGLLAVLLLWYAGKEMFGSTCGLFAAWCLAFAHPHIYQSQEIRMYAPMYMLALVSMLSVYQAVTKRRGAWWVAHFAASALLVWTHLFGVLVLVAQGLWLLWVWRRRPLRAMLWGAVQLVYLVPLALWILGFDREHMAEQLSWQTVPEAGDLVKVFLVVLPGACVDADPALWRLSTVGLSTLAAGGLVWACALWLVASVADRPAPGEGETPAPDPAMSPLLLMIPWCVLPVALLYGVSILVRPCFVERYFAHCAFPLLLVAGAGLGRMSSSTRLGFAVAITLAFLGTLGAMDRPLRPDMRGAAHLVNTQSQAQEKIYLHDPFNTGLAFRYYTGLPEERTIIDEAYIDLAMSDMKEGNGVWIVHTAIGKRGMRTVKDGAHEAGMRVDTVRLPGRRPVTMLHAVRESHPETSKEGSRSSSSTAE